MRDEPTITVNGSLLTVGQAMTVRVALGAFALDLRTDGLGDDQHGTDITRAYLVRIKEVMQKMTMGEE